MIDDHGDTITPHQDVCPSCGKRSEYRDFLRSRACPSCKVSFGFSVPYRVGLATCASAAFLYGTYRAVFARGILFSVIGLVVAVVLAFIARLLFISNIPPTLHTIGILSCPICSERLTRIVIRPAPFDCPHCVKQIRPIRTRRYRWVRAVVCGGIAIATAKLKGFDWSFLVFVVSVYAIPALLLWDIFALDLQPTIRFEPTQSSVQTLGIGED